MTEAELVTEYWKITWNLDAIEKAEFEEFKRIWQNRVNELNETIFKLKSDERAAYSKLMSERLSGYELVKLLESRSLVDPTTVELLVGTQEHIQRVEAQIDGELRGLREKIRQLEIVRDDFDRANWPRVEEIKRAFGEKMRLAGEPLSRILEELRLRFPNSDLVKTHRPTKGEGLPTIPDTAHRPTVADTQADPRRHPVDRAAEATRTHRPDELPAAPAKSELKMEAPAAGTPQETRSKSLDLARKSILASEKSDLLGVDRGEWLVEPDRAAGEVEKNIKSRKEAALKEALAGEPDRLMAEEVARRINQFFPSRAETAAKACVEEGKAVYNRQPLEVRQKISRGRAFVEMFKKGIVQLQEGDTLWNNKYLARFFLIMALWDIGKAFYDEGWFAGTATAVQIGATMVFLAYLSKAGIAGLLLSEVAVGVMIGLSFIDLWGRLEDWIDDLVRRPDVDLILGNRPWEVTDASGNKIYDLFVGFRTFEKSPAFGLDREKWFLKYPNEWQLRQDIVAYSKALNESFSDPKRVPPQWDALENLNLQVRVIRGEWAQKWAEERQRVAAERERLRSEQLAKERSLTYALSGEAPPDPEGHILAEKLDPELPKPGDPEVKVKAYFGIAGIPGEKLEAAVRMTLARQEERRGGIEPQTETRSVEFGVNEAIKVIPVMKRFQLSGPGDYQLTISLDLGPRGKAPAPEVIKFVIGGAPPPKEEGYAWTWALGDSKQGVPVQVQAMEWLVSAAPIYYKIGSKYGPRPPRPFVPIVRARRSNGPTVYGLLYGPKAAPGAVTTTLRIPLRPGPQEIAVEALSPAGEVLMSQTSTVTATWSYPPSEIPKIEREIADLRRTGASREALFSRSFAIVREHIVCDRLPEAEAAMRALESEFRDLVSGPDVSYRTSILSRKYDLAVKQGSIDAAVAALEARLAARGGKPADRVETYYTLARACLTVTHEVAKAWAFWQKYQEACRATGQPVPEWPFAWPVPGRYN